ncbi:N-formylglutamate amidohydrolase [Paenibacillus alginolyticus]|uniref:N-formylglutamate amidohydrolase n=1 Tax=Paenibacillus alginolyticus TaxID=59839 RepID=A0ABT4GLS2_9BACL|nr:N-formylglutamate amidohydrolase [Paenibacillus alginolyticus]MCY9697159.1 N-formylglutamate amidohydrolase [Paenibacillus alginolyticus]MEC0145348.1 N-formylglutamate amidohydrolase [Paenibacillus alginolyticus]
MDPIEIKRSNPISALIASIPHGSSQITPEMRENKKSDTLLANNDWFLNELYNFLAGLHITVLSANYSRYVIDVNRDINIKHLNEEYTRSLIYQKSTFGKEIYDTPLVDEIISNRIQTFYMPYHNHLSEEIDTALKENNRVFLLDLHSFYVQSAADVVLGTCEGKTCSKEFLYLVYNAFTSEGFVVRINEKGLTGGYIVSHYGSLDNVEAIQIELRYTSYIENREFGEEEVVKKNDTLFSETQGRLIQVFKKIKVMIAGLN